MSTPAAPKSSARIDPLVGTLLAGKYKIIKKIGEGGMGSVYIADQQPIDRKVAVKVLLGKLAEDDVAVKRFEQEARAISKMQHPNTVTIYDFGQTEDDRLYIVMEYLKGKTLTQVLRQEGVLAPARASKIMRQVCGSLADAHAAGIIHRDLKPDNIFLSEVGGDPDWVKVLDFGVAKLADSEGGGTLTQTGMIFGTPKYMSPEQAEGRPIDYRADIYALGVVMYELLVGRPPFVADTPVGLLLKHISEPPPPFSRVRPDLHVDPRLEAIVMKSLEKHPDRRQQIVGELANELSAFERAVSGAVMMPTGAITAQQAVPGLPTEVVPGAPGQQPASLGMTPAGLAPPNQVPGNLSLSGVPSQTKDVVLPTGMATAQGAPVHATQGHSPTAMSTLAHGLPTAAQGVMPFAANTGQVAMTHGLTSPIPAPGGGVDTLGGLGNELSAPGLKRQPKPKPTLLYGGIALVVVAAGFFAFAMKQSGSVSEPIHEPAPDPAAQVAGQGTTQGAAGTQGAAQGTAVQGTAAVAQPTTGVAEATAKAEPAAQATDPRGTQSATPQPRTDRRPATETQARDVPAPPSKTVNLTIESTPSGATVWLDERQAGTTPFTMSVPRDETLTFVFKKPGYEDASRIVVTAKDRTLAAELAKAPEPKAAETVRTDTAPVKTTPVTKPKTEPKVDPSKLDEKVDDLK